jgi:hypothetical protein
VKAAQARNDKPSRYGVAAMNKLIWRNTAIAQNLPGGVGERNK